MSHKQKNIITQTHEVDTDIYDRKIQTHMLGEYKHMIVGHKHA